MKVMTIGVIGAGRIGKLHTDNILQHFPFINLKCVADPNIDTEWASKRAIPNITRNVSDLIDDPEIEAVLVCSPSPLHAEHVIACANAKKHVFCEKPISTEIEDIIKVLKVIDETKVKFQVGFNRRFDPNFAKIKSVVKAKEIGNPHLVRITSRDPKVPPIEFLKSSGGMFVDMTIHDFDMAQFLIDSPIDEVYAVGEVLVDPLFKEHDDIDTAIINLKFKNGAIGVIDNSRQAVYGYDQRVEVFCSEGAVEAHNNKPTNTTISTSVGVASDKPLYYFLERYKESFIKELEDFFNCITANKPTSVSGRDGLYAVLVAAAANESLKTNRPQKVDYSRWPG